MGILLRGQNLARIFTEGRIEAVKRSALFLAIWSVFGVAQVFAQGMPASRSGAPTTSGKINAAAVWQPPQDFLTNAHNTCDKQAGPASFGECFINQMSAAGAPAGAVAFTRMLYRQSDGQVGIMTAFQDFGVVDAAQVLYPLRANDNYGLLLVNGEPPILDVDDLKKLDQSAMEQNGMFQSIKKKFPQTDIWPGDRSAKDLWPRTQPLPGGGTEFIVSYPLINGCHACDHVGLARFSWQFDANGKFLRTVYIPTPPPPKLTRPTRQPGGPPAQPQSSTQPSAPPSQ